MSLYPSADYYQQGSFGNYKVIKVVNNSFVNDQDKFICKLHYSTDNKYYFADESNDPGIFDSIDVKTKNDTLLIERFTIFTSPGVYNSHARTVASMTARHIDLYLPIYNNIIAYGTNVQIDSSNISSISINLKKRSTLTLGTIHSEFGEGTYNGPLHLDKLNVMADSSDLVINGHIVVDSLFLNMTQSKIDVFQPSGLSLRTINGTLDKQVEINGDSDIEARLKRLVK